MLSGMADETPISRWLREEMPRRGYPLDGPRAGGISRLADDADISRASLSRVVSGQGELSVEALRKIGAVFGMSLPEMMVHAGMMTLDEVQLAAVHLGPFNGTGIETAAEPGPDSVATLLERPPADVPPEIVENWANYLDWERFLWWLPVSLEIRYWIADSLKRMMLIAAAEREKGRAEAIAEREAARRNGRRAAG